MDIYSNGSILVSVEVDDSSYHYEELMNKNVLQLEFSLAKYVEIPAGAYCFHNNRRYELISGQSVTVVNRGNFSYSVVFEAGGARLRKYKIRLISDKRIEFDLSAKASEHVALIVANMNEREGSATNTWTVGTVLTEETDIVKLISYSHNSCLDALNSISSTYETEWEVLESTIDGVLTHTINIGKVEYNKGNNALVLSYGDGTSDQKGGLQSGVQRSSASDSQAIGRLYVECGDRNIELKTYGSKKLHLPCPSGASLAFKFDGKYFEWETGAGKYEADGRVGRYFKTATDGSYVEVDASIGRESYKSDYEESIDLTDIYPKREGEVTVADGVPGGAEESPLLLNVVDDTLNHMTISRITGEQFVIRFIDGPLGGREFGIMDYSPVSNTIYVQQQEEDGYTMPDYAHGFWPVAKYTEDSEGNRTPTGQTPNKYALFGCVMPTAYIYDHTNHTGAEYDALRQACEYLYEHMDKKYALSGTIDDKWLKRKDSTVYGKICKIGGYVKFYDPDILPSQTLVNPFYLTRVLSCKTYINNPYKVEISISNQEVRGSVGNALVKLENNQTHSEQLHRDSLGYSKRGFTDAKETAEMLNAALFDEFTSGIYPVSVQTMQMIAGSEKLQFLFITGLNDATQVACPLSYNASEQTLSSASASYILHKTLGINTIVPEGVRTITDYKRWEIPVWTSAALTDGEKRYYVYAKVVKDSESMTSTGVFLLSETEIAFETSETEEGVTTYYYNLLVGMLNSERDGDRSFVTMYGFTEVLPGQITTDVIRSSDGQSFLNLVANKFHLGASGVNTYIDWNNEEARKLRVRGDIVADTLELEGNTDTQGGVTVTVPSATIKGLMVLKDNNTVNNTVTSFWDGVTSDNVIFGAAYSDAFNKSKTFIANPTSTALADRPDFLLYRDAQNNRVRIYIKDLLVGDTTLTVAERLLALETTLTEMFELDTTSVTGKTLIHAKYGLYSNFQITAGGIGSGGGGGTAVSWGETSGGKQPLSVASVAKNLMLYPAVEGTTGQVLKKTATGIAWQNESGGGGGTSDYTALSNKPTINNIELSGNKTSADLGIFVLPDTTGATGKFLKWNGSSAEWDTAGGGSGEPSAYLKSASVSGNTLTLTNKDNTTVTFSPDIPNELSELSDDATHRLVTDAEKATWNSKSDFSGDYTDLTNKPTIPAAQVQTDWDAVSGMGVLLNKPDLSIYATTSNMNTAIAAHHDSTKVDKVSGKGLSENDFTDEYLANVESNIQARHTHGNYDVLNGIDASKVTLWDNKADLGDIPTSTSELINDGEDGTHPFLDAHQTITLASGTNNGTLKITTAAGTVDNVAVTGLGSIAYKSSLVASDIPDLDASKITSGTFADERIASASNWEAMRTLFSEMFEKDTSSAQGKTFIKAKFPFYSVGSITAGGVGNYQISYDSLSNRPQINGVTLTGNQTSEELELAAKEHTHTVSEITDIGTWIDNKGYIVNPSYDSGEKYLKRDSGGISWATVQGGSGEPSAYIKSASVSGNTLTLTKKDNETITFTPTTDLSAYSTTAQMDAAITAHHDSTKADVSSLAAVATSGSYNDLDDRPNIPDEQIQADWSQTTTTAKDYIKNKPTTLSGYGITDAKIQDGVITLGGNSITPLTSSAISDMATKTWVNGQNFLTASTASSTYQRIIDSSHKLSSDLVDDSGASNKFITSAQAEQIAALVSMFTKEGDENTGYRIKANFGLYSNSFITAGGLGSGGSGGTTVSWGTESGNTCNLTVASNTKKVMLYPSGTNGHYLRKTANGIEWAAVSAGATDYTSLTNKPSINSVELSGNKSLTELGIAAVGHTHNYLPLTGGTLSGRLTVSEGTSVPLILNYNGSGNDIYAQMRVSDTTYGGLTVSKGSSLRSAIFGVVNNDYKYLGIDAEGNPTYVSSLVSYSLYHNGNANNSSSDWVAKNLTAAAIRGSFISIHPEQSDANILPYFSNDLAFLEKKEGALRIYTTTETDFTIRELTGIDKEVWGRDSLFDGSSAYCGWGNVNSNTVLIFDITLNKVFGATNQFYIDFGNAYWAAKEISVYTAGATGNYTLVSNSHVTNNTNNYYRTSWNGDSKTNVRVVLKGFPNGSGRIAEIGMINYNSTLGRETFMSRGCDDDIYRNLTPNATNTYALGSASKRWNNVYANAIDASGNVNVEGDLSCDGLTVGDNPLPSTNGTISLGNTSHYWKNVYAKEVTFNEGISIAFNSDTGGMTASGTFEVQSELSAQFLNITEDAGISGNLSVAGGTETTTLSVTGNASVGGNASIGGNITPSGTPANQNIGSTSAVWGKIYANKWYPKANDANTYIEYVTSGNTGYFAVHGNIYASGAITAASSL